MEENQEPSGGQPHEQPEAPHQPDAGQAEPPVSAEPPASQAEVQTPVREEDANEPGTGESSAPIADNENGPAPEIVYNPGEAVVEPEQICINPPLEAPDISADLEAIAAGGGAVAATVLGLLTVGGSFVTNWSIINGIMGIMLGLWGLSSRRRRLAWIGLILCFVGSILSIISINDFINQWWLLQQDPA
ncbi:MAG: hypothetical protein AAF456_12530 [Planctomycetota bacterium]